MMTMMMMMMTNTWWIKNKQTEPLATVKYITVKWQRVSKSEATMIYILKPQGLLQCPNDELLVGNSVIMYSMAEEDRDQLSCNELSQVSCCNYNFVVKNCLRYLSVFS